MSDVVEFEEGEIGDLSDFEDCSRSQPVTPIDTESEFNKRCFGCVDNQGSLSPSVPKWKYRNTGVTYSDEENVGFPNDRPSKPISLLELLSDDEGCVEAKKSDVAKKKRKKRHWDRSMIRRNGQKIETPRCRFYMEGRCNKGSDCPFSHDFFPDKKQELCKFYAASSCSKGNSCQFLHGEFPCKFFHLTQNCYHGDSCKFSHRPLTPRSHVLLDRFVSEKHPNSGNLDVNSSDMIAVPPVESSHKNPPMNDLVYHSGDGVDHRMPHTPGRIGITPTNMPPISFPMCPPRSCLPSGFDTRPPFQFSLRGPPIGIPPRTFMSTANQLHNGPGRPPFLPFMMNMPHRFPSELPFPGSTHSSQAFRCPPPTDYADNLSPPLFPQSRNPNQYSPNASSSPIDSHNVLPEESMSMPGDTVKGEPLAECLTIRDDFVLSLSKKLEDDNKSSNWRLVPLEIEEKLPYLPAKNTLQKSTNDPRLVGKLSLDPRLQPKKLMPVLLPNAAEISRDAIENSKETQKVPVVPSEGIESQGKVSSLGNRRRVKLQLNEMANNFVSGDSLDKESPTNERPYLLDPRIKRRRIIPAPSTESIIKSPLDESSGSSMQISLHCADGTSG